MNPESSKDRQRLKSAIMKSRQALGSWREQRYEMIREYVGKHYGEDGAEDKVPVPLMEITASIYTQNLVPDTPRSLITSSKTLLQDQAQRLEMVVNQSIVETGLEEALGEAALDALFGIGIIKSSLVRSHPIQVAGKTVHVTRPNVSVVDLDDWVHDMHADRIGEAPFAGNRYRVPLEQAREMEDFRRSARHELKANTGGAVDDEGTSKVRSIGRGADTETSEYREYTDLIDVWLPEEGEAGIVATFDYDGMENVLNVVDWEGPDGGPYDILSFTRVPGNAMPLPPMMLLRDLHELANSLFRKVMRQADRAKSIGVVSGGQEKEATRIMEASDGDVVAAGMGALQETHLGGAQQTTVLSFQLAKALYSWSAGNLDALGGLAPMSETLGQDRLLFQSASGRMQKLQRATIKFIQNVVRKLAWWEWTEPYRTRSIPFTIPGTDITKPVVWLPSTRMGRFLDHDITLDTYSLQRHSPSERLALIMQMVQNIIIPLMPMIQQQGGTLHVDELVDVIKRLTHIDELSGIVTFDEPTGPGAMRETLVGQTPRQSPVTHRTHERISRPAGANPRSEEHEILQALAQNREQQPAGLPGMGR